MSDGQLSGARQRGEAGQPLPPCAACWGRWGVIPSGNSRRETMGQRRRGAVKTAAIVPIGSEPAN